jgi:predicted nucleic acid-binding protein
VIVLLDTTVLIDVLRGRSDRYALLADMAAHGHTFATSAMNIGEVYAGMRPTEESRTEMFLSTLDCYPVTQSIARRAGKLKSAWARKGKTLDLPDMVVAATALEYGLPLMTDNRKDFPLPELNLYPLDDETAAEFFKRRSKGAKPDGMRKILNKAPRRSPDTGEELD